ncbi:hypothetical protein [Psychroserpens sp. SPM9]|uniref:hypothetical protein n=1 Tax=Psychroserpens sp. SPM9 TaxID=2975598 RepID=UPI0021A38B49|nr:hypothetical protein [Psychroserpens sp. SPM9]MDG5491921.1 hypothetical protein [Psychroserpens sp. SPM9]
MKTSIYIVVLALFTLVSCERVKTKTQETINAGGEVVGKSATEFVEGVSEGIDKTLEAKLKLSPELQKKGVKTGKFTIADNPQGGNDNMLTLYIIFDKDYDDIMFVKVFDKNGLETGRAKLEVKGAKGDANYFDFTFNERTEIEYRSLIVIE